MKSFIRARVFKSRDVEVSSPRMLKSASDLLPLSGHLEFLKGDLPQMGEGENLPSNWQKIQVPVGYKEVNKDSSAAAQVEADTIMEEARVKAEAILREAQLEAEGYKDQLAEKIWAEISEQAYAEGYNQGYEQGLGEGKVVGQKLRDEAEQLLNIATKAFQKEYARAEDEIIHLSVRIAERILRAELSQEPQKLFSLIKNLTLLPHERSGWRLHISSQDGAWFKALQPDQHLGIPFIEEDTLIKGDCFLECEEGLYDARIESQLRVIEEALREEFKRGELEQPSTKD